MKHICLVDFSKPSLYCRYNFLYDGNKLYASELAFMPGTFLPSEIKDFIGNILCYITYNLLNYIIKCKII